MRFSDKTVGHLAMIMATLFFGFNIPFLKYLMPDWLNSSDTTLFRLGCGAILFWIASIFVKSKRVEFKDFIKLIFIGILGLFSFMLFFDLSIENGSPVDVSIILSISPILVLLISSILYRSPITKMRVIGILLSLSGAIFLVLMGGNSGSEIRDSKGIIFSVISVICYASYITVLKPLSDKYNPVIILRWAFLFAMIPSIPLALPTVFSSHFVTSPEPRPILTLMFIIFFPTFLSYLLMPIAIKRIGQILSSMYQYFLPVITTIAAVIMKQDKLEWDQPIAVIVIFLGVYISSKSAKQVGN